MGIADSMKGITGDILNSYDERVKALTDLVTDTQKLVASARKTLKGFASDRKKMSSEQAEALSSFVKSLARDVGGTLKTFNKNRRQLNREQVKIFEAQAKSLAEFVKILSEDVASMMNDFSKQRIQSQKDLKGKLAKKIKEIQSSIKDTLKDTQQLLGECRADTEKARKVWREMCAVLAKSRKQGIMSQIDAGTEVTTVEAMKEKERKGKKRGRKSKKGKKKY